MLPLPKLPFPPVLAEMLAPPLQSTTPVRKAQLDGDVSQGFVQVLTDTPDDTQAYVLMVSRGVQFLPSDAHSLVPAAGVLSISKRPDNPGVRYVWRG